ncbi:MAG: MCE family protein [Planctomycetes bacterium]|jgi:phospholipid/cholesterol/gamma-HCH transport system substrate-binding protein|nr:MCE family protein [Planctomycetota bacterium]MCL4731521.1 MCE family protein [Planctomycetota bacterium]
MSRKGSRSDLITGAFTIGAIVAFLAVVGYLQGVGPKLEGARYSIVFDDVGGLTGSANVVVAGQRVGKVEAIRTLPVVRAEGGRQVEVEVSIIIDDAYADTVVLPVDTIASVQMGSLFGANQLVLKLGSARDVVRPGSRLPQKGQAPASFNDLFEGAEVTLKKLQVGIDKLATVIEKDDFSRNVEQTLASLASAMDRLEKGLKELEPAFGKVAPTFDAASTLLADIRKLIEENNAGIGNLVKNLESASGRLDKLMAEGDKGIPELVAGLNGIAGNLDTLLGNLNNLVLDNQLNLQISMQNIRDASASLRIFARRIERDPSLLVWGSSEDEKDRAKLDAPRAIPNVDELSIRNSGRRPRKESD